MCPKTQFFFFLEETKMIYMHTNRGASLAQGVLDTPLATIQYKNNISHNG